MSYRVYTEEQFQELHLELSKVNYDCEAIRGSFRDSPLHCCGLALDTAVEVQPLYGGRGVSVVRIATCTKCQKACRDEFRMRDGYLMKRDADGRWVLAFREQPLLLKWLRSLFVRGRTFG